MLVNVLNFCFFQTSPCLTEPLLLKYQIIPAQVFPLKASQFTRICKQVSIICSVVWVKPNIRQPVLKYYIKLGNVTLGFVICCLNILTQHNQTIFHSLSSFVNTWQFDQESVVCSLQSVVCSLVCLCH